VGAAGARGTPRNSRLFLPDGRCMLRAVIWRGSAQWRDASAYLDALHAALDMGQPDEAMALLAEPPGVLVPDADFGGPLRRRLEAAVLAAAHADRVARGESPHPVAPADLPAVRLLTEWDTPDAASLVRAAETASEPVIYLDYPVQQAGWRNLVLEIEALRELSFDPAICLVFISGFSFFARREFLADPRLRLPPAAAARFLSDEFIHLAEHRDPFRFAGSTLSMHLFEMYLYAWTDK
jgi:hypothetical protein